MRTYHRNISLNVIPLQLVAELFCRVELAWELSLSFAIMFQKGSLRHRPDPWEVGTGASRHPVIKQTPCHFNFSICEIRSIKRYRCLFLNLSSILSRRNVSSNWVAALTQ
jgi:hypothetical protein